MTPNTRDVVRYARWNCQEYGTERAQPNASGSCVDARAYDSLRTSLDAAIRERDELKRKAVIDAAVLDLAYAPHRLLVEDRDSQRARRKKVEAERDALRAALKAARMEALGAGEGCSSEFLRFMRNGVIRILDEALAGATPQPGESL